MRANNASRVSLPRGSYKSLPVLVDKCFERRRRPTTNRFDQVVRSGEDPVLVVDGDLAQVLDDERIARPGGLVPVQTRRTTLGRCVRPGAFAPRRPSSGAWSQCSPACIGLLFRARG